MNELLFFVQTFAVVAGALIAYRLGSAALSTWVTIQALIANLFVLKQVQLFGFDVTASDTFAIGSLIGLNLLQEYYSREEALKASRTCFFFLFFFALISQLHLSYQPSDHDFSQTAFLTLLSPSPRLFLASIGTFFIVQQIDIALFAFLRTAWQTQSFAFRTAISLIISQLLDTALFSVLGLYGIVASLVDVIIVSFLIKLLAIFSFTSILQWAKQR